MSLDIRGFIETSLVDWDGKIVGVIFLPGCNFRCPFCQNIGLIDHPEKYKSIPEDRIIKYLDSHKNFIDGICITGGEPTLQKNNGLTELISKIKRGGFLVKLDTNGTDPEYLKYLINKKLIDFVAMDIKAPFDLYNRSTNVKVNIEDIKRSVEILKSTGIDYEFRTTMVPTLIGEKEIETIARALEGSKKYVLQQFEPENCEDIELKKLKPYDSETVKKFVETAKRFINNVKYRGK